MIFFLISTFLSLRSYFFNRFQVENLHPHPRKSHHSHEQNGTGPHTHGVCPLMMSQPSSATLSQVASLSPSLLYHTYYVALSWHLSNLTFHLLANFLLPPLPRQRKPFEVRDLVILVYCPNPVPRKKVHDYSTNIC